MWFHCEINESIDKNCVFHRSRLVLQTVLEAHCCLTDCLVEQLDHQFQEEEAVALEQMEEDS